MNGKIADRRTSAAMAGIFLIKPGQLNRTLPDCQESFNRQDAKSAKSFLRKQESRNGIFVNSCLPYFESDSAWRSWRLGGYCGFGQNANATAAKMHRNAAT
jgi:hypothetical protein